MADKPHAPGPANVNKASTVFDAQPNQFNSSTPSSSLSSSSPFSFFTPSYRNETVRHQHSAMASNSPPTPATNPINTVSMSTNTSDVRHQSFASPMAAHPAPKETKKLDISSLMSPPDALMDSFNQHRNSISDASPSTVPVHAMVIDSGVDGSAGGKERMDAKHPLPMSPPISPYQRASSSHADAPTTPSGQAVKDPVLYPHDDSASSSSPPQPPLFATAELEDHRRIVDGHVRARSTSIFGGVSPPRPEEYVLALSFRSQVMKHYMADRKGWLRKERELLKADRRAGGPRYHTIMPAKPVASSKPPRSHRADRVSKPHAAPRTIRTSNAGSSRPAGRVSATPEPSRRVVAPNREDKDFNSLPDYCPPLNSLPNRPNSLKVDWKGQPIDLSGDPHANLLHPDEVLLAGNLRLDCATYLTSKRRIFERRLQCLRSGKEFRKTDAQQACKIDVNKASKLWTAFDKVGWLDAEWVRRFQ